MNDLLLIVPSRSRQERIISFKEFFDKNSVNTDLCFGLDDDQYLTYPKFDNVIYDINPNMKLGPKLNTISAKTPLKAATLSQAYPISAETSTPNPTKANTLPKNLLNVLFDNSTVVFCSNIIYPPNSSIP